MKKTYETPSIEKIAFQYRDQVVAASGGHTCIIHWNDDPDKGCTLNSVERPSEGVQ